MIDSGNYRDFPLGGVRLVPFVPYWHDHVHWKWQSPTKKRLFSSRKSWYPKPPAVVVDVQQASARGKVNTTMLISP
jgi:hypothetical protein